MSFNQASLGKLGLAGQAGFGFQTGDNFQEGLNRYRQATQGMSEEEKKLFAPQLIQSLFPSGDDTLVRGILEDVQKKGTKEYQQEMLELADKYQTRKGIRQSAFNLFGSGMDNLMKGIGMSMNPYGTPEGLQNYLALTAGAPQAMAAGYQSFRTPMNIPAVQGGSAPAYF